MSNIINVIMLFCFVVNNKSYGMDDSKTFESKFLSYHTHKIYYNNNKNKEDKRVNDLIEKFNGKQNAQLYHKKIYKFPSDPAILKKLNECGFINLSNNYISNLPFCIKKWKLCNYLDLSSNRFKKSPWQIFNIGKKYRNPHCICIDLTKNPIKKISKIFFNMMVAQERERTYYQGFSIVFDEKVINNIIFPILKKDSYKEIKGFLMRSTRGEITSGFCLIQNEKGELMHFDMDNNPFLKYAEMHMRKSIDLNTSTKN